MVTGDTDIILGMIFVLFLPAYGYLLAIHGEMSAVCEKTIGLQERIEKIEWRLNKL